MSIEVRDPGVLATLQAPARVGYERLGVPRSGPMDQVATQALNTLLGNTPDQAVIELAMGVLALQSDRDQHIAVLAQGFDLHIDDQRRALAQVHHWPARSLLKLRRCEGPGYAYLGIAGNWQIEPVLGSVATDVRNGLGGLNGRPLQRGDRWQIQALGGQPAPLRSRLRLRWPLQDLKHPQLRLMVHEPTLAAPLFAGGCEIDRNSNRQAILLHPASAVPHRERSRISTPQWPGAIQALPDGRFAILGPEAQTIGGYPLVASVCAADLSRLGRISGGQSLRGVPIALAAAAQLARQQQAWLQEWLEEIARRREQDLTASTPVYSRS